MHAQRSLGFRACRLGPLEGLTHTYSGPHQLHATTPRSSVAMVGTASGRGLGGSAAEFVLPPPPRPPLRRHPSLSSSVSGALMPRALPEKWGCRGRRDRPVSRRRRLNMFSLQLPPIPDLWFGTIQRRGS